MWKKVGYRGQIHEISGAIVGIKTNIFLEQIVSNDKLKDPSGLMTKISNFNMPSQS